MSDEKQYTERDVVRRERKAFMRGYLQAAGHASEVGTSFYDYVENVTKSTYPLPKVTRLRVMRSMRGDVEYRVVDGRVHWRYAHAGMEWHKPLFFTAEDVPRLAELVANPTETVEDDG